MTYSKQAGTKQEQKGKNRTIDSFGQVMTEYFARKMIREKKIQVKYYKIKFCIIYSHYSNTLFIISLAILYTAKKILLDRFYNTFNKYFSKFYSKNL